MQTKPQIMITLGITMLTLILSAFISGCDQDNQTASAQSGAQQQVAGPVPISPVPTASIKVMSAYTGIFDAGTHATGRRTWSVPGRALEYVIDNTGTTDLLLTGTPNPVTVTQGNNLIITSVMQPAETRIRPGKSVSFAINFTVPAQGGFQMSVTIPTNANVGQSGPTFDFRITGTAAPELGYVRWTPGISQYLPYASGTVAESPELSLLPQGWQSGSPREPFGAAVSPDGSYIACTQAPYNGEPQGAPDSLLWIFATDGSGSVLATPPVPHDQWPRACSWLTWTQDAAGRQLLCFLSNMYTVNSLDEDAFTCVVSGTTPLVSNLNAVSVQGATRPYLISSPTWSSDASRLAFSLSTRNFPQTVSVYGCPFSNGVAGTASNIIGTPAINGDPSINQFEWAANGTIVIGLHIAGQPPFGGDIYAVSTSLSGNTLVAGARISLTTRLPQGESGSTYWTMSPNGKRVAFLASADFGHHWPYAVEVKTTEAPLPVLLAAGIAITPRRTSYHLAWAPDSRSVAWLGDLDAEDVTRPAVEVFLQAVSDQGPVELIGFTQALTSFGDDGFSRNYGPLVFSAEGQRIMFIRHTRNGKAVNFSDNLFQVSLQRQLVRVAGDYIRLSDWRYRPGDGSAVSFIDDDENLRAVQLTGSRLLVPGPTHRVTTLLRAPAVSRYGWLK